jgi:NAD(P)-dependent dehydrogenase (short-subunit alcohol dehydrogenase family)
MKKQKYGVFINASSLAFKMPLAGTPSMPRQVRRFQLHQDLCRRARPYGIRVVSYLPGMTISDMCRRHIERDYDKLVNTVAAHRIGKPEDWQSQSSSLVPRPPAGLPASTLSSAADATAPRTTKTCGRERELRDCARSREVTASFMGRFARFCHK